MSQEQKDTILDAIKSWITPLLIAALGTMIMWQKQGYEVQIKALQEELREVHDQVIRLEVKFEYYQQRQDYEPR